MGARRCRRGGEVHSRMMHDIDSGPLATVGSFSLVSPVVKFRLRVFAAAYFIEVDHAVQIFRLRSCSQFSPSASRNSTSGVE